MSVRERFNGHLPEYGTLWRALAAASAKRTAAAATAASSNPTAVATDKNGDDDNVDADDVDDQPSISSTKPDAALARLVSESPISSSELTSPTATETLSSPSFSSPFAAATSLLASQAAETDKTSVATPSTCTDSGGIEGDAIIAAPVARSNNATDDIPPTMTPEVPSLLPAILGGKTISLRVPQMTHSGCDVAGCEGGCADPIFEDDVVVETEDDQVEEDSSDAVGRSTARATIYRNNSFDQSLSDGDGGAFNIDPSFEEKDKSSIVDGVNASISASSSSEDESDDSTVVVMDMSHLLDGSNSPKDKEQIGEEEALSSPSSSSSDDSTVVKIDLSHILLDKEESDDDGLDNMNHKKSKAATSRHASTHVQAGQSVMSRARTDSYVSDSLSAASIYTSEEEWNEGGDTSKGDANEAVSAASADKSAKERSFEVIILSDDDDIQAEESDEKDNSEFADDSFVEEVSISSNSEGSLSSSDGDDDDDIQIVEKPRGKQKSCPKSKPKQVPRKRNEETQTVSRSAFVKKREHYTTATFAEFNIKVFDGALSSVEVTWSKRLKTTAGLTRLKRIGTTEKMRRIATIELSTKILDSVERLRSTLLHELCHAAAWLVDGVHKPPHGIVFRKWANLSMRKIRDVEVTTKHDYVIQFKYAWKCTNTACGAIIKRHSRSVDPKRHCCGSCSKGKLIEIEVPGSKNDVATEGHTPKKKRPPTGFSLFVQQNSKSIRARLAAERGGASVTQPDVMKECGRIWRKQKESRKKGQGQSTSSSKPSARDENIPYDLNRAVDDMENRLKVCM